MKTYKPVDIKRMSDQEARRAYADLRPVMRKRQQRLLDAGFRKSNYANMTWEQTKDLTTDQVRVRLADISLALRDKRSTVKGMREWVKYNVKKIQELNAGYKWLNEKNFFAFTDFMEKWRERYKSKLYDSGDALDAMTQIERLDLDPDDVLTKFDEFIQSLDEIEKLNKKEADKLLGRKKRKPYGTKQKRRSREEEPEEIEDRMIKNKRGLKK